MMGGVIDGVSFVLMVFVVGIFGSNSWFVCIECGDVIYLFIYVVVFFFLFFFMIVCLI